MPNKAYIRGKRFEQEVVRIFREAGFGALRSAASKSPFDVVIWKEAKCKGDILRIAHVAFVQCKTEKKKDKNSLTKEFKPSIIMLN